VAPQRPSVALREVSAPRPHGSRAPDADERPASASGLAAHLLAAIERDPKRPARAVAAMVAEGKLDSAIAGDVERFLRDYERGGVADPDEAGGLEIVERAVAHAADAAPAPAPSDIPARLGHYRIIRTLSAGPSSAVVLAQQESPIQREVAIKLMFEDASDPRFAARVELERQTLASLEHPNIARIYDFGIASDHRPYMVMEHVGGGSIVEYCRRAGLALRARVELFLEACAAIRAAHTLGVLHCDLKPANILVQVVGGEPHAKVIDFGIARTVRAAGGERGHLAEIPHALGTLAAMSPEALVPGGPPLDTRADVFGLGLVLLELVAMRPPRALPPADLAEALRVVLEEPIPRASRLAAASGARGDRGLNHDLDAVVAKATAREKRERYESVDAFIRDLERWLAGDAVTARERLFFERARSAIVRRRLPILLAAVALVALAPLVAGEFRAGAARDRAIDAANEALAAARELRDLPGTDDRRGVLLARVAEETRAGLLARPGDLELLRIRVAGVEEELLARLMRADATSQRSRELALEAERLRREIVALRPGDLVALSELSVALAYKLDTIRDEPGHLELQQEQFALDRELHERDPKSRLFADNLSWTYQHAADRAWERGEYELSLTYLDATGELGEVALALEPTSPVSTLTAAAGHLYALYPDLIRGDRDAAHAHVLRSLELSGALLAREPQYPRAGAFHLSAAHLAAWFVFDPDDPRASEEILDRAIAAVSRNDAAKQNTTFLAYPYFDVLSFRVGCALRRGDTDVAAERAVELRSVLERMRFGATRPKEFTGWDSRVASIEAWAAILRDDDGECRRGIARALEAARVATNPIQSRLEEIEGIVGVLNEVLEIEEKRGVDEARRRRFAELREWVRSEVEADIAEGERTIPGDPALLPALRARAVLLGDRETADAIGAKIDGLPPKSYQWPIYKRPKDS